MSRSKLNDKHNITSWTQVALSSVTFSKDVFPPAPPPITAWYLGELTTRAHNVQGRVYALDSKTLLLSHFHFDGNAPGISWSNSTFKCSEHNNIIIFCAQPLTFEQSWVNQGFLQNMQLFLMNMEGNCMTLNTVHWLATTCDDYFLQQFRNAWSLCE